MFEISRRSALKIAAFAAATSSMRPALAGSAILPSWVDGNAKARIMDFVTATTTEGSADFVEPAARVAVFDNDGTLWGEQPTYVQLAFALDRVKQLAPQHPEWQTTEPFKSVLAGDMAGVAASGERGLLELVAATHAGMSAAEFEKIVSDWIASARHPASGRPYTGHIFQPMVELIDYLKANQFEVFIVSGGGVEFMRPWTERVYGIPPQNVVGSSIKTKYELRDGVPAIMRLPEIDFIDDGPGKPVGINKFIGKHPIAAFGNSDGDFEMLEWTTSGHGRRFGLIVHHDDAQRENAYDRDSHFGRLARGLDEAPARGWTLVSIKDDWKVVYPE
ncbi:haloacid dehalogenase-like hydrolase [Sinorhizobium meliloti]|uniref:HAD family hydrolase n=1 Tax=Rhizobium meliloti TaxID=382 RepID=UPI000B4A1059|nr:HAD family hydrolase [Sinorhizobium meliloti]ASQ14820.1 haloacid dehalogenase-like hydrolase [Sinorhizobium meliloti]MDE4552967.1 haloacid dehalogenase-like hydrolase [Sinorhizobium meliloti]MDW9516129.1 haloacid dehalogenase-like hydrolase [Sinorhizobium meliloti]MDW9530453.1 haloacid dehalogenase-like hydrolase [Sinorhizobium meliloti]MDW9826757.1 haloacid dehalogenase-like hydrolase [Sinorhizobium meliloti]